MRRYRVIKCLETIEGDLQLGNSAKAEETLQKSHEYLQELMPNDFSSPSSEEIQIVDRAEQIYIENAAWNSKNGTIFLSQMSSEENLLVRSLNVYGALAFKMYRHDIAVNVLEQSVKCKDDVNDDNEELNVSLGVAHNNLGCVYISKGSFQNAKESLETAFERFEIVKNSTNGNVVKENIVTVLHNLRQVHQAQRNFTADRVRNDLFTSLQQALLSPRIIFIVKYNEACASIESRNLTKALNDFQKLKSFCEKELNQAEEVVKCISLKICLVYLLQGNSSKAAAIIDTEASTLPELIEFLDLKRKFPPDFSVTATEALADICVHQGNQDLACKFLAYLVTICQERCGANHPATATIMLKQGLVFSLMGKTMSSRQCLTGALEIFTRVFGAVHPDVLKCEAALVRLESRDGLQEKALLHSQRVLENVEKICQVSFMKQLKERFMGKVEDQGISIPETDQEEHLKLEILTSEFGVEVSNVLSQHQPTDLGENIAVSLPETRDCPSFPVACCPEEVSAMLSFNFLKVGLRLFNLGKVAQSTVFLLLSCTYTKMFHNSDLYCSDVMLVQVISVLCHLKATQDQSFLKEEQLVNEFRVLQNYIEGRFRQHDQHERKSLFFDEIVNLKVSLSLFLRSFIEMEMFEMIDVIRGLFSKLQNHHSQKMTNVVLVEELRFVFFSSNIECLGRTVSQDLIFSTPIAVMPKVQNPEKRKAPAACQLVTESQNSSHKDQIPEERQPRNMYRTLVLKRNKTPSERFCRFLVYCPISNEADIAVLAQINVCSVKSIQDTLPQLILRNQNHVTTTQYFMELEPLDSLETDTSSILSDLSLLPLILSSADEGAKSGTQPLAFITTVKTCEGTVAFTFPDRATSTFLFGKLMKPIFTNMENLGEVADVEIVDGYLVLKIQRPSTGQIVIWCVDNSIKIKTQLIHATQSTVKRQVDHEEMSPCSCPIIKMFFAEEMEKCAGAFGILFEKHVEKTWCISSILPTGNKTLSLEDEDKIPLPASSVRMELQRSASHQALPYEENRMLSESCTQTDSLSIPTTFDLGTQTDESVSPHHLETSTAGFVTDASDTLNVNIISRQMNSKTQHADIPVKDILKEDINHNSYYDRSGDLVDATTLLDESPPVESSASSGEKFRWPPYVSRKQGDSNMEEHEEDGSNSSREEQSSQETIHTRPLDSRSSFAIPLTWKADQRLPCVELPKTERHLVTPSPTGDWRGNDVHDLTDSTVNREMVMAGKNKPQRRDATDISRYRDQAKGALQDHPSFYSSSAIAKSPFKGGYVIADDSPRHPDHGANDQVDTSSACDDINKIQRNTKTSSLGTTPFRAAHEPKCSDEGSLVAARSCGLKGGRKDQSATYRGRHDTRELDESSNWSRNGAKPKRNVQGSSDAPFSRKRAGKVILPEKVGESDYFGIRPVFLARHTDDNSISMASDMWNMENTEEWSSDILSGYQRFGYYPDQSYHTPPAWPAPMPHPEGPDFFAGSQGLSPILMTAPDLTGTLAYLNSNEQRSQAYNLDKQPAYPGCEPGNGVYPSSSNVSIWNLPPPPPMPSLPCDESECNHALLNDDLTNGAVESRFPQVVSTAGEILFAQTQSSTSQAVGMTHLGNTGLGLSDNVINQTEIGQSAISGNPTSIPQNVVSLQAEVSSASPMFTKPLEQERIERESAAVTTFTDGERTAMQPGLPNSNSHLSDDGSLAALEQRVAEACSLVERVLKEREEREKTMKERERRQREERAQREQQERARREREAREARQRNESGEGPSTGSGEETPSQHRAPPASARWLCEHYQRLCRVKFPCCGRFYPCHRCHNNSDECANDNCRAKEAFYLECSVCRHQQEINQDAQTCARCKTKMSAYFCSICKHFTGEDKYPYHCTKCGICRIHKDRSFHCDVCNVCLDKRLQGKHKCRPDSGHDECCICLEDAFSGCQILPCSHKVHRECAIAMIQNGVRSCPICRHPLYSQTGGTK